MDTVYRVCMEAALVSIIQGQIRLLSSTRNISVDDSDPHCLYSSTMTIKITVLRCLIKPLNE